MPAQPSPAQSETSRINGAASAGPATEAGKAASSRNALRHGLCAAIIRLTAEEEARAAYLRRSYMARWRLPPEAAAEVEALVIAQLKLTRLGALEMAVLGDGISVDLGAALPSLANLCRYHARLERAARVAEERLKALATPPSTGTPPAAWLRTLSQPIVRQPAPASTSEPEPPRPQPERPQPDRPLNRHERRRLAALERRVA